MEPNEEEQITQVVIEFLKTADMNVTTERTVLAHVQNTLQLTKSVSEYKPLVSSTIDKFLESLDAEEEGAAHGGDGASDGDEGDQHEDEEEGGAKRGRKRAGAAGGGPGSKKPRGGGGSGSEELLLHVDLSARRKARVRRWEGKLYIDVREFYAGDAPTQKGLSMDPGQWARLVRDLPQLVEAQRANNAAAPATQISKTRLAAVSEFKGTYFLGLREYYEKGGELAPTKKGVNLSLAESEALLAAAPRITAAAGGLAEAPLLPEGPAARASAPLSSAATTAADAADAHEPPPPRRAAAGAVGAATTGAATTGAALAPSPAAGGGGAGADGGGPVAPKELVELGGSKRMSISRFQGRLSVDLREYYEKNGNMMPGKKGIALSPADWMTVISHLKDISDALARRDMSYMLQLSGMRRVSLSEFKGVTYVGIREFYDKGGELAPSAKGLSMNPTQWAACAAGAPAITAALQQAQAGR